MHVCRLLPPKLLRKPRYGAFHLFAKTPRDDPTEYPLHRHFCLDMGSAETRTSQINNNLTAVEVCASSTCYTFRRSAPPSTSLYHERKSELQTGAIAYAIATEQRLLQIRGQQTGAMAYAIAAGRKIPQLGGRSSRIRDPSGRPRRFIHGSMLQIGGIQTGAMAYAIATGRRIPQLGGQSSRSRDPSGRPRRFIHG